MQLYEIHQLEIEAVATLAAIQNDIIAHKLRQTTIRTPEEAAAAFLQYVSVPSSKLESKLPVRIVKAFLFASTRQFKYMKRNPAGKDTCVAAATLLYSLNWRTTQTRLERE
eukprot:5046333-Pleurochrysis_carterae.AAC.1